ncbi:pyruvate formate lyase activating enzyme [Aeromonas sp. RU39B]|jgi:pyruvate formate lyase activating enzyme|uniref:pyruvate formate lyase 1-activating protein n=1 Tax=Aeromonas sp. RU39B TaxID=1907416 RepID=UPI000954414B|nr:pyruvate formate lyase 1-activating protein [Aeromonas sp. RU39B]SIP96506.1 pyruvate formate lyase activating enzyme [Aeromonas sp. RU39B]
MSVIGRIHSVETCGTVDGPGIRFIVFLQGCLMRCKYCHNRDTWDTDGGREVTVPELMKDITSYRHFINASGGGVTASGGEAMLQQAFVAELFAACKAEGIHTCLDTNGFVRNYDAQLDAVLAVTDLVLLDIKQINDDKHIPLTHVSNRYTLEFARHLARLGKKMWIRYVVVPTWTDDDESAEGLGRFIAELGDCVEKIELLPYHELGKHKWEVLGDTYELGEIHPPKKDTMERIKGILSQYHPNVKY